MDLLNTKGELVGYASIEIGRVYLMKRKATIGHRYFGLDIQPKVCDNPKRKQKEYVPLSWELRQVQELSKLMYDLAFKVKGAPADRLRAAVRELEANLADARRKNDAARYRAALKRARAIYTQEIAADLVTHNVSESV